MGLYLRGGKAGGLGGEGLFCGMMHPLADMAQKSP